MSVRQYIGARYVTKIYENSLDPSSAEWEQVNYEPLVLVTYNNGSYLSKKSVPASVGDPASNPSYWVQTGFYNGQIASLQAQIDDIVATLHKKVLVISDSYTTVSTTGWDEIFEQDSNISEFYNLRGSGYGFSRTGYKFLTLLQASAGSITDKDKYTDIIVGAGANDVGINYATISQDISDFKDYCTTNYPNAKLHIAFVAWSADRTKASSMRSTCYHYRNACHSLGIDFLKGVEAAMHNSTFFNIIDYPDEIHPNQDGNDAIGHAIAQALYGHTSVMYQETAAFTPDTSVITTATTYLYNSFINDDVARLQTADLNLTFVGAHAAGSNLLIGTFACDTFKGNFAIPLISFQGYTDYLFTNWNGNVNLYLTHAVNANDQIQYYPNVFHNYDVMQN